MIFEYFANKCQLYQIGRARWFFIFTYASLVCQPARGILCHSGLISLSGVEVGHFWLTLILLGIGWNFGFVGASALVLDCHRPEDRARVQSFNDFIVFGAVAIGSFLSGGLLTAYGWSTLLGLSFVPLALAPLVLMRAEARRTVSVPT